MYHHHQFRQVGESSRPVNSASLSSYYQLNPVGRPGQTAVPSAPSYDPTECNFHTFFREDNKDSHEEQSSDPLTLFAPRTNPAIQEAPYATDHDLRDVRFHIQSLINSTGLSDKQKITVLTSFPSFVLDNLYEHFGPNRFRRASAPSNPGGLNEATYTPLIPVDDSAPAPTAPQPVYPPYARLFTTAEQAKRHRRRSRVPAKSQASDIERVKRYGRAYWTRRIYAAMIDISTLDDGTSSIHRQRFAAAPVFDPTDLEATAHHVFDGAVSVHERGWIRPALYHKKVVRGKLVDISEKSLEKRLERICVCLRTRKATVDDAVRGGVTLALLCDNPEARGCTKASNNMGNKKRGERLKAQKAAKLQAQQPKHDEEQEQEQQEQEDDEEEEEDNE